MKTLSQVGLLVICLTALNIHAQRTPDIGFQVSSNNDAKMILEYRVPVMEKWTFNLGTAYGQYSNWPSSGTIVHASDSTVTQRRYTSHMNMGTLRFGMERQMGTSMFSFGADIIVGYRNINRKYSNLEIVLDSSGNWNGPSIYHFTGSGDPDYAQSTSHYITPGIQVSAKMDIPLGNRFFLNLFANNLMSSDLKFSETKVIDPHGEFAGPDIFTLDMQMSAGIGLRYRFKGKESEDKPNDL